MVNWLALSVPFVYLFILIGSLATFSSLYRARKAARALALEPWFPSHLQKDVYLSLLHIEPESGKPKVPDSVLKAALLRRAMEDIKRIIEIRNSKPALAGLLQRGSVGDDLWQRFLRAEKEIEEELRDVVTEANAFAPGWGQTIFQSANEMAANAIVRERLEGIQSQSQAEKEWWENKRATIQSEFMKELDEDAAASASKNRENEKAVSANNKGSDDDGVLVEKVVASPAAHHGGGKKKKKGKH